MATKVYLSGRFVVVEKAGEPVLNIPPRLSMYTVIQPVASNDGLTIPVAVNMTFSNFSTQESRTEAILEVQNQAGQSYSDLSALQAYLTFIPNTTSTSVVKEGASTENQEIIIAQNTSIEADLEENEKNTRELNKIKKELQTNNKILKKIYN